VRRQVSGSSRRTRDGSTTGQRQNSVFALVYTLVRQIPQGKVATYGQIARLLGAPRAARIVGWAMHGNPHGCRVPCHRVIQQGGTCSPSFRIGDPGAQRRLLEREGVRFTLDGRVDLEAHLWRPDPARVQQRLVKRSGRRATP
jgi:methylated-DNA-protein-cysteine methyltransferase-like protein